MPAGWAWCTGRFAFGRADYLDCALWDLADGTTLHSFAGHSGLVGGVSINESGERAVSASSDATVRVWDASTGRCTVVLTGHDGPVRHVALSGDGAVVASGGDDRTARVWDAASGRCRHILTGHEEGVRSVSVSADGSHVVSATWGVLRWWRTDTGMCVRTIAIDPDEDAIESMTLSLSGEWLVVGSVSGSVLIWDLAAAEQVSEWNDDRSGPIVAVRLTRDGQHVVAATANDLLTVWSCADGKPLRTMDCQSGSIVTMDATPDGHLALVAGEDGTASLWRLDWEYEI